MNKNEKPKREDILHGEILQSSGHCTQFSPTVGSQWPSPHSAVINKLVLLYNKRERYKMKKRQRRRKREEVRGEHTNASHVSIARNEINIWTVAAHSRAKSVSAVRAVVTQPVVRQALVYI